MKTLVSSLMVVLSLASSAIAQRTIPPATINKHVVTASGDAEMFFGGNLVDTRERLAGLCQKIGWAPRGTGGGDHLFCDVPSTEFALRSTRGTHSLEQLAESGSITVPVRKQVTFILKEMRGGTLVRARAARLYPAVNGGVPFAKPIGDENTFNGLLNIMALIGGRFAPGTTFRRVGYIGFRSDSLVPYLSDKGEKRVALMVGAVDQPSPAADAGVREGDQVKSINGKSFSEYDQAAKIMSVLRPGEAVQLQLLRAGAPLEVSLVTIPPPAIR